MMLKSIEEFNKYKDVVGITKAAKIALDHVKITHDYQVEKKLNGVLYKAEIELLSLKKSLMLAKD